MALSTTYTIFDFNSKSDIKNWRIINDAVMGGESTGSVGLNLDGHAIFKGEVSLANNGGFSSLRYNFKKIKLNNYSKVILKIKGDNKNYQFRLKSKSTNYYSYIKSFSTNGKWQEIEILLSDMYPSFRGRKLDKPNFSEDHIEEIAFLIGNKSNESFELLIDEVRLN